MKLSIYTFLPKLGNVRITASKKGISSIKFIKKISCQKAFAHNSKKNDNKILLTAERELKLYAQGKLKSFSVPIDLSCLPRFTRLVLYKVKKIPYGTVISYKQLALLMGNDKLARAVGNSLGKNPVPIIIPCHRVISSNGSTGGFSAGLTIKKRLLAIEQSYSI